MTNLLLLCDAVRPAVMRTAIHDFGVDAELRPWEREQAWVLMNVFTIGGMTFCTYSPHPTPPTSEQQQDADLNDVFGCSCETGKLALSPTRLFPSQSHVYQWINHDYANGIRRWRVSGGSRASGSRTVRDTTRWDDYYHGYYGTAGERSLPVVVALHGAALEIIWPCVESDCVWSGVGLELVCSLFSR